MADIRDMTAEELRAYAAKKEAMELHRSHIPEEDRSREAPAARRAPWERDVEVDGTVFTVDMRRFKSRRFMRLALAANDEGATAADQIDLFDYAFEPVEDQILAEVERRVGYEDFEEYYGLCGKIFEAVEAKN